MQCKDCGKDIPDDEVVFVEVNGHTVSYPYCEKCAEEWQRKIDDYPKK